MSEKKSKKSGKFKSVTFNVRKTLNDSHFIFIQLASGPYYAGSTIFGHIFLAFSDPIPIKSCILSIKGWEEAEFEIHGSIEKFYKTILLKSEYIFENFKEKIDSGEYFLPFEIQLPENLPLTSVFTEEDATYSVKYEIKIEISSKNKIEMEDIIAKKRIFISRKTINIDSKINQPTSTNTITDNLMTKLIEKEDKITSNKNFLIKSFFCLGGSVLSSQLEINGLNFLHKITTQKNIERISYLFIREIRLESIRKRIYFKRQVLDEQEAKQPEESKEFTVKITFNGNLIGKCPSFISFCGFAKYFLVIYIEINGCCNNTLCHKQELILDCEKNNAKETQIENMRVLEEEKANIMEKIVFKF